MTFPFLNSLLQSAFLPRHSQLFKLSITAYFIQSFLAGFTEELTCITAAG